MFDDRHEYLSFKSTLEREQYWIGRLVKAKIDIKINLFDEIETDTLGLVLQVGKTHEGLSHMLVVKWITGEMEACYQHDVFSYNDNTLASSKKKVVENT